MYVYTLTQTCVRPLLKYLWNCTKFCSHVIFKYNKKKLISFVPWGDWIPWGRLANTKIREQTREGDMGRVEYVVEVK